MKSRRPRWLFRGALAVGLFIAAVTFRNPWFFGNFGVVEAQRVYRSAQPDGELPLLIARYHLASVLNLRGGSPDDTWYNAEIRATRDSGDRLLRLTDECNTAPAASRVAHPTRPL